jgi:16S rRNA (guanine527-N7)-methyltransferase
VESNRRRAAFLARAVTELALSDRVTVWPARAEEAGRAPDHRGAYELVTARSFGPPAVTAECGAPLLAVGGCLVVSDPPEWQPARWPTAGLALLGLRLVRLIRTTAAYVVLTQVEDCPDRYPRRTGVPQRRPLFHVEQGQDA